MRPADGARFRELLSEAIPTGVEQVALLFSGGTDSLTILWTLLDLGVKVTCYTFRLEHIISIDSRVAQKAARHWGAPLVEVIPAHQEPEALAKDIVQVIHIIGSTRKTHVEVMWGYWHLLAQVEEEAVFSGLQADSLYGSSRSMAIKYSKDNSGFTKARKKMIANPDQDGHRQALRLAQHFGKALYTPYTSDGIREFMLGYSWLELNRPKQKMPAVLGFISEFRELPVYRRNDNMQCGAGVREYMARMLESPVNKNKRARVLELYKDIGHGQRSSNAG